MTASLKSLPVVFLLLTLASCGPNVIYDKNKSIPGNVWNQDNIVRFDVVIPDSLQPYDLYISLRHTTDYQYSNLYLFVETVFPGGTSARDTIELILADHRGKWHGKGTGKIKDNKILIRRGFRFPVTGEYSFFFEQAMREEDLEAITDIGMSVERN